MGSSSNESNSLIVNMKYLALAIALFAAVAYAAPEAEAEAEAAADAWYGYYGYGRPYYGYRGYYGYGGYYGYPYGRYGFRGYYKREAEAEPQFLAPYSPLAYAYAPYYYAVPGASSFQRVDTPAASYGVSQIHKREAEADADAEAAADAWYGYYGRPYGYGYPYYGLGYYGGYGYPYHRYYAGAGSFQHVSTPAATYGISQVHKREAEADPAADAYLAYYGHGATSYVARSPQGLKGYYGYPYAYYGYGHRYGYPYWY